MRTIMFVETMLVFGAAAYLMMWMFFGFTWAGIG